MVVGEGGRSTGVLLYSDLGSKLNCGYAGGGSNMFSVEPRPHNGAHLSSTMHSDVDFLFL